MMQDREGRIGDGMGLIPSARLTFEGHRQVVCEEVGRQYVGAELAGGQMANRREPLCFQEKEGGA